MKVYLVLAWMAAAAQAGAAGKSANQLLKDAQRAEASGDLARAYMLYSQAAVKKPRNPEIWAHARALRPLPGPALTQAEAPGGGAKDPDPGVLGSITDQELAEARKLLPPQELEGSPGSKDLDLRGESRQLFQQAAKEFGLEAMFDSGYQPKTGLRLRLDHSDFRDTLRALEAASGSFVIPLNPRQFLVANDTPQKRTELDRTAAVAIPAPEPFSLQDVQEIATGVRGTLDIQRLVVDGARRLVLVRDRVSKVRMAQKVIADLMTPRAQVAIEVQLLETSATSSLTYGLSLPTAFPLVWFGSSSHLTTAHPSGYSNFLGFGGGKSSIGLGVTNASLFLNVSQTSARTLLNSEVVTSDGQPATLHVGDRYPIVTTQYLGGNTSGSGQTYAPPPTFNFEDLGLILKITPHVHGQEEMTLEVESEFKLLGAAAVDGIPIISNRKFQSKARLSTGEWAVLAGLMTDSEGTTLSGIPGLATIPLLRHNERNRSHGETLIVLKPHILSLPPTETIGKAAWVGTETRPRPAM